MVIQHNLTAMNSNRQLGITTGLQAKSSEKLSSGYKINRAADDAAGLAISEKMRRQIRGLDQASDNVQDGISYVQVADAALAEIDEMLHRMTELCVKAANETLTDEDRGYIDSEIQQLKAESNRTFHTTTFNEKLIWDEKTTDRKQIGTEVRPIFTWNQGTSTYYGSITEENKGAWPADSKFSFEATSDSIKVKWTGYDGVDYESNEIPMPSVEELRENGLSISLNSTTIDYTTFPAARGIEPKMSLLLDSEATIDQLVSSLNESGVTAYTSYSMYGTVSSSMDNPRISVSGTMNYLGALVSGKSISASSDTEHIVGTDTNKSPSGDTTSSMSFSFTMTKDADTVPAGGTFGVTATNRAGNYGIYTTAPDYQDSKKGLWWDYNYYGQKVLRSQYFDSTDLLAGIEDALNEANSNCIIDDSDVGGTLYIQYSLDPDESVSYSDGNGSSGSTLSNGFAYFTMAVSVGADETAQSVIDRINSITGLDLYTSGNTSMTMYNYTPPTYDAPIYGGTMALNIQAGSESTDDNVIPIIYDVLNNHSLKINALNTLTSDNARSGIESVKAAQSIVDEQRSVFGAYQNRMEHAYKNLTNTVENTQHSESVIRDTDMAAEMVKYSNNNILAQAGQSILAQANQTNQGVLSLLQ